VLINNLSLDVRFLCSISQQTAEIVSKADIHSIKAVQGYFLCVVTAWSHLLVINHGIGDSVEDQVPVAMILLDFTKDRVFRSACQEDFQFDGGRMLRLWQKLKNGSYFTLLLTLIQCIDHNNHNCSLI